MIKVYNITKADIITGPQIPINKMSMNIFYKEKKVIYPRSNGLQQIMYFLTQKIIKKIDINFSNSFK